MSDLPVDVLGVIRRFSAAHHATLGAYPTEAECDEAYNAVSELLAADIEVDAADVSLQRAERCGPKERVRRFRRLVSARDRRLAAIQRFKVPV